MYRNGNKMATLQPSGKLNYSFVFGCAAPAPPDFKVEPKIRVSAQIEMKKYSPNFEMWGCGGKSENALCCKTHQEKTIIKFP